MKESEDWHVSYLLASVCTNGSLPVADLQRSWFKNQRSRWGVTNSLKVVRQTIYKKSLSKSIIWEFHSSTLHLQNFTSAAGSIGSTALVLWSLWLWVTELFFFMIKRGQKSCPPVTFRPYMCLWVTRPIWPFPGLPLSSRAPGHRTISNDSGAKPIPMRTWSKLKVVCLQGSLAVESDPMKFHKHGTESCFKYLQICCSLGHWELEAVLWQQRMPVLKAFPGKKHGQGTPAGFTFFSHKASCSCSK